MKLKSLYKMCLNGYVRRAPDVQRVDGSISFILDNYNITNYWISQYV